MTSLEEKTKTFVSKAFIMTLIANMVWINISEVFRYFVFVMPAMRDAFPQIDNVAPMSPFVFAIWGLWDTILVCAVTGFAWLFLERFGRGLIPSLWCGTLFWLGVFCILWIGLYNMNLAPLSVLAIALPLAWVEMVVAAMIVNFGMGRISDSEFSNHN